MLVSQIRSRPNRLADFSLLLAFFVAFFSIPSAPAKPGDISQKELKAAFLFHMAKYVTWPPKAFASSSEPIRIGVVGDKSIASHLKEISRGVSINGRSFQVAFLASSSPKSLTQINMLYISKKSRRMNAYLSAAMSRDWVLTVSDRKGFAKGAGMVEIFTETRRLRFNINKRNAAQEGLQLSSRILALAKKVYD